jgi:[calcium/calmodulin-dependent protein kinase] kinase
MPTRGGNLPPHLVGLRDREKSDALFYIREEIAIMKKLNHPNLAQLIEVLDDPDEDSLYMVMEMCKKGVIMKVGLCEEADPYPEEECRFWFRDLILGIEYRKSNHSIQGTSTSDLQPRMLTSPQCTLKASFTGTSNLTTSCYPKTMSSKSSTLESRKCSKSPPT